MEISAFNHSMNASSEKYVHFILIWEIMEVIYNVLVMFFYHSTQLTSYCEWMQAKENVSVKIGCNLRSSISKHVLSFIIEP